MRNLVAILSIVLAFMACSTSSVKKLESSNNYSNDTIRIANDSLNYELIVFEPGFSSWIATQKPRGFYSQNYLEQKNWRFVVTYNNRVVSYPYSTTGLYPQKIDYEPTVNYGYEVNYLLYHYFLFFQEEYNQKLR
ncbi:hypothetical protein SAMN04488096_102216 [Mesonia phycicola]|uniref:Lipoprotein n=1 Tax=Mesonia phycicola TaxID=579105 RepID=A0A1M6BTQ9_9FLAO|nr:DUF6146 family protein [Mesonia phycicola]SHI52126.1 hypothetical protein SAMN04488096_102216 [Mesonia phycicola]